MESSFTTFYLFPRLPEEVRLQIWTIASSEARTLNIRLHPHNKVITDHFISSNPIPAVLQTCCESRDEAAHFYTKAFYHYNTPRYTWVNFDRDTIHIEDACLSKVRLDERVRIKWIAIEVRDEELWSYFYKEGVGADEQTLGG